MFIPRNWGQIGDVLLGLNIRIRRFATKGGEKQKTTGRNFPVTDPLSLAHPGKKYAVRARRLTPIKILAKSYQFPIKIQSKITSKISTHFW